MKWTLSENRIFSDCQWKQPNLQLTLFRVWITLIRDKTSQDTRKSQAEIKEDAVSNLDNRLSRSVFTKEMTLLKYIYIYIYIFFFYCPTYTLLTWWWNLYSFFIFDMRLKIWVNIPQHSAWYIQIPPPIPHPRAGFLLLFPTLWTLMHGSWSKLMQILSESSIWQEEEGWGPRKSINEELGKWFCFGESACKKVHIWMAATSKPLDAFKPGWTYSRKV